jgi:hypothetical protein
MKTHLSHSLGRLLLLLSLFSIFHFTYACSGYKITKGDKTILGSNEDAWRTTPHIWFENKTAQTKYGAAFTGSRFDGDNGYAPQSGMNEAGLAFERLVAYHPKQTAKPNTKTITNPTQYLKDIIHQCQTVEEVRDYINQYDYSYFIEDVFIYVDRTGKYLIVEPYKLSIGNDPSYIISNYCPSITSDHKAQKLERYKKGKTFLNHQLDTTAEFCKALSDTMHVCRKKIGDGTLLSSIWDLKNNLVSLYFYHNYDTCVQFNLNKELSKGDHSIAIETLFPKNAEFERLGTYKIPKNNMPMGLFVVGSAIFMLFSSLYFLIRFIKNTSAYRYPQLGLSILGLMLVYYMYVLLGSINIYYFPAPFNDPGSLLVSASSYLPFVLLMAIIPIGILLLKIIKHKSWNTFAVLTLSTYVLINIVMLGLFGYWEFFNVF